MFRGVLLVVNDKTLRIIITLQCHQMIRRTYFILDEVREIIETSLFTCVLCHTEKLKKLHCELKTLVECRLSYV